MSIIRRKNGDYAPSAYVMSAGQDDPTTLSITIYGSTIKGKPRFAPLQVANLRVRFDELGFCVIGAPPMTEAVVMERDNRIIRPLWGGPRLEQTAWVDSGKWRAHKMIDGGLVLMRLTK